VEKFSIHIAGDAKSFSLSGKEYYEFPLNDDYVKADAQTLFTILVSRVPSVVYHEVLEMAKSWENIGETLDEGFFDIYWQQRSERGK